VSDWLKHILTEPDGSTFCPVRVFGLFAGAIYHAGGVTGIVQGHIVLDMATMGEYLQHMCYLVGTIGAGTGVKSLMNGDAK